jgi:hypothetical protein
LGLQCAAEKGHVMIVGDTHNTPSVTIDGCVVKVERAIRFLGIMITADGRFAPWRDSFDKLI